MRPRAADPDGRVRSVRMTATRFSVALDDGRIISVPLAWYPRLAAASPSARRRWEPCAGGHGIHWPLLDEDLSVAGLLRGAPAPPRR